MMKKLVLLIFLTVLLAQDPGLDLPVNKFHPVKSIELPPPEVDPVDEEEPVLFYGEELISEASDVVFVIDRSGSMWGNRLPKAVSEVVLSIDNLPEEWSFSVVAFDNYIEIWSGQLEKATGPNKASAISWCEALRPRGSTATDAGTVRGLAYGSSLVVLLTDGAPNGNRAVVRQIIRVNNGKPAVIDVYGISATDTGMRSFCIGVANDNNGSYYDVP